jgi:spermidine synthase
VRNGILLALFGLSGACGLIYELLWIRSFSAVFGIALHAAGVVIAAFMGGLALGSWFMARRLGSPSSALQLYGRLEISVGLFAIALPWLIQWTTPIYGALYPALGSSPLGTLATRFILSGILVLIPSALLGATFPLMVHAFGAVSSTTGSVAGKLYAINTTGAVAGTLASIALMASLGVEGTNLATASVSIAIGAVALLLYRVAAQENAPKPIAQGNQDEQKFDDGPRRRARPYLALAGATGFVGLGLEIVWMRALSIFMLDTLLTYAVTLGTFLAGLALGGAAGARLARATDEDRSYLSMVAFAQLAIACLALASPTLLRALTGTIGPETGETLEMVLRQLGVAAAIMLLPSALSGATLPLLFAQYARSTGDAAAGSGRLYALNTVGAIFAAVLVGMVLIPTAGTGRTSLLLVLISLAAVVAAVRLDTGVQKKRRRKHKRPAMLVATSIAALTSVVWLIGGEDRFFHRNLARGSEVLLQREDSAGLVEVILDDKGIQRLIADRKQEWGATTDLLLHSMRRQGLQQLVLHPQPRTMIEVGLATGINLVPAILHPTIERIDVVEISPAIVEAAGLFSSTNRNLLEHEKVRVIIEDGRSYLTHTNNRYDIIVLGLFVPYRPMAGYLYSREIYEIGRSRLQPGGLLVQWLPLDQLSDDALRTIIKTFMGVFPQASAFDKDHYLMLVGGENPLRMDVKRIARDLSTGALGQDAKAWNLHEPWSVVASFAMGPTALRRFYGDATENTIGNLAVELSRPGGRQTRAYETASRALERILAHRKFPDTQLDNAEFLLPVLRSAFDGRGHRLAAGVAQVRGKHAEAFRHFSEAARLNPKDSISVLQVMRYRDAITRSRTNP